MNPVEVPKENPRGRRFLQNAGLALVSNDLDLPNFVHSTRDVWSAGARFEHDIPRFAGSELSIGENDGHLSSLGHRVAAREIVQEIQHLLPPEGDGE